jgi:hypothetical protein
MEPTISELTCLDSVAEACIKVMPESTWWGLRFIDSKYLGNWGFSPYIEVFRHGIDEFRVKISGSHEIEPSLTSEQIECMIFLGWELAESPNCDCLFSPFGDPMEALKWFKIGLDALQIVFGINSGCAIAGSNEFVNAQVHELEGSRWSRKLGGYRLSKALYNRLDLR